MNLDGRVSKPRTLASQELHADLVVVGGGLAGLCCAITAARAGLKVILVQDRPVLGGNASSEVRLWVLGATSHMGNNNRWAREGGVIDELLVENMWRNPEGNSVIFDSILLEFATREQNLKLLLNTSVSEVQTSDDSVIRWVGGYCSQNETRYVFHAPLFCDASGDGVVGFLSGAAFRMGAEARSEFGEGLAPPEPANELLGHSLYFYTRDTGKPVRYIAPSFALRDITKIPRFRELNTKDDGCRLWWLEYGGNRDTIHESEDIKWELWRVAYGVWDYIKNSGEFPEAENLTLEWVGSIPGKRESRRFEGDILLTQKDIVEQRLHADAVSYGGWAIDLHPPDGVYSKEPGCTQWHSKGVYQIPYRTMYSRNIRNLFLTGRIISSSHIAFGSTRVMATSAHNGQAVGMAAALCIEEGLTPRDLVEPARMKTLQQRLLRAGQFIPGLRASDPEDLATQGTVTCSSELRLARFMSSGETVALVNPVAVLLPLPSGAIPEFAVIAHAEEEATLRAELWQSSRPGNTSPDVQLAAIDIAIAKGYNPKVTIQFGTSLDEAAHVFLVINPATGVSLELSQEQVTGILMVSQRMNKAVAKSPVQIPPVGSGVDSFAFWLPARRPAARMLALSISPPLAIFGPENVVNGFSRPWCGANAWLPSPEDCAPTVTLSWPEPQTIRSIHITFDTDFDHPMESVLKGHPERVMPACIRAFDVCGDGGRIIAQVQENHQTRWTLSLEEPMMTTSISVVAREWGSALPAIFEVRCY